MIKVDVEEAGTHLSRYLDQVASGDVVVVCRHDRPVAELCRIPAPLAHPTRIAGLLKGRIHWDSDAFDEMTPKRWRSLTERLSFLAFRLEITARYLRLPLVSGGFPQPFRNGTRPHSGPRKRNLPKRGVSLGDSPQVQTGKTILALASLNSDPGSSRGVRNHESFPHGADALASEKLQLSHKDPFDRMLIAQAIMGGMAIITSDSAFDLYPVRVIW